jgi:hypothetical protein
MLISRKTFSTQYTTVGLLARVNPEMLLQVGGRSKRSDAHCTTVALFVRSGKIITFPAPERKNAT